MKLSAMELHVDQNRIWGHTSRLDRRIISIDMTPGGEPLDVPAMYPRLFVKALPETDRIEAVDRQVIMMVADTKTTQMQCGEATIDIEPSEHDPLYLLAPKRILGASYAAGNQVLNPGRIVG
jgi:hypothetical protein